MPPATVNVTVSPGLKLGSATAERVTLPAPLTVTLDGPSNEPPRVNTPAEEATFQV